MLRMNIQIALLIQIKERRVVYMSYQIRLNSCILGRYCMVFSSPKHGCHNKSDYLDLVSEVSVQFYIRLGQRQSLTECLLRQRLFDLFGVGTY